MDLCCSRMDGTLCRRDLARLKWESELLDDLYRVVHEADEPVSVRYRCVGPDATEFHRMGRACLEDVYVGERERVLYFSEPCGRSGEGLSGSAGGTGSGR